MNQAIYRFFAVNSSDFCQLGLTVNNYPLPNTSAESATETTTTSFIAALVICRFYFAFLPASIVVCLVKENQAEHSSKHQQLVFGVALPK